MTVWTPTDNGYAEPSSHDACVDGPPHNTFARLRRDDPLHRTELAQGADFWSVTRNEDISTMNKNTAVFSSAWGIRMEDQSHEEYKARRTFQETDPPEHSTTRMKLFKAFSRTTMAQCEDEIRDLCQPILDAALDQGTLDATMEIARQLPMRMRMLGRVVGLPEEDLP